MNASLFKKAAFFLALCIPLVLGACAPQTGAQRDDGKITVVATMFPQYDFARAISGDLANVSLLVPPGGDTHSFEPSPSDVARLSHADIFLYTGAQMEPWVAKMLAGIDAPQLRVIDLSAGVPLRPADEGDAHTEEGHTFDDGHDHGGVDPHIWTSPRNAMHMLEATLQAFLDADPNNGKLYQENANAYSEALQSLDTRFREIVRTSERKDFIFGSRFACTYFAEEYGLHPDSPYASCSGETEPGAQDMARVIEYVKANKIPVLFHQELSDTKVAQAVAEATGARLLLFHSCHNVSKDELAQGATYLSLMQQNAQNLEEGLN